MKAKPMTFLRFAEWYTGVDWRYIDNNYGDQNLKEVKELYSEYYDSGYRDPDDWWKNRKGEPKLGSWWSR